MKVMFTERAYISVLSETAEKIHTETGGIFLGYRNGDIWHIVESIDPGPKSVFEVAYFEYDQKYVNHLSQKIARLYNRPLELLGLWHRHPGSFNQFSRTDNETNKKYAALHGNGAISALVNIDPDFRLTVFHVTKPYIYTQVPYSVEKDIFPLCDRQRLLDYLNGKNCTIRGVTNRKAKYNYDLILDSKIKNLPEISSEMSDNQVCSLTDENVTYILQNIENDTVYLSGCHLDLQMLLQDNCMQILCKGSKARVSVKFFVHPLNKKCCFKYYGKVYSYTPKLFQTIIEDVVLAMNRNRMYFSLDEEFVRCSLQKMLRS